ncbi:MAG: cephalosporin hydroxylase [Proteobacteria bacterium]|nr:cephalosporin hydroxylase [Pseudomonadota bacterium]
MSDFLNDPVREFEKEKMERIAAYKVDKEWQAQTNAWICRSFEQKYMYNFSWMGRPIIQFPQDILAMQEIIFSIRPDLIIETGIAHGGSLIFYASMLELNAACGGPENAEVLGVDIDVRQHNRKEIESHPMFKRISMIEGSSLSEEVIADVTAKAKGRKKVMVCLDSNHTHDHVLAELEAYASLASLGSYCVVFDTIVEDVPKGIFPDRPWGPGNNPKTAVMEYLKLHPEFEIDKDIQQKLLISVAPDGYLRRIA